MPNTKFDRILQKDHLLIQFRPTLPWLHAKPLVVSKLEKKYQEWQVIDPGGPIILFSPEEKQSIEILTNQINFFSESINSNEGLSHIDILMKEIVENYSVEIIRRLMSRFVIAMRSPIEFNELTDLIHKKLYNDRNIQGGKLFDLAYVLDTTEGDMKIHTLLGPAKKDDTIKNFQSKFEKDLQLDSDTNLFIDVTVSMDNEKKLSTKQIAENLKIIKEKSNKVMEDYISYLTS